MGAILQQTAVVQGTGAMLTKIAVLLEENAFLRWTAEGDVDENGCFVDGKCVFRWTARAMLMKMAVLLQDNAFCIGLRGAMKRGSSSGQLESSFSSRDENELSR